MFAGVIEIQDPHGAGKVGLLQLPVGVRPIGQEYYLLREVLPHGQSRSTRVDLKLLMLAIAGTGPAIYLFRPADLLYDHDVAFFPIRGLLQALTTADPWFLKDLRANRSVNLYHHHLARLLPPLGGDHRVVIIRDSFTDGLGVSLHCRGTDREAQDLAEQLASARKGFTASNAAQQVAHQRGVAHAAVQPQLLLQRTPPARSVAKLVASPCQHHHAAKAIAKPQIAHARVHRGALTHAQAVLHGGLLQAGQDLLLQGLPQFVNEPQDLFFDLLKGAPTHVQSLGKLLDQDLAA